MSHPESLEDETGEAQLESGEHIFMLDWEGYITHKGHIHAQSTESAAKSHIEEFKDVFSKNEFDQLSEQQ